MGGRGSSSGAGKGLTNSKNSGKMDKGSDAWRYKHNAAAIAKTLSAVESKNASSDVEVGTIVDLKGKVIDTAVGKEHGVMPQENLLKGNIFTHNHPTGGTFSSNDIHNFVKYGLHEVRATTPDGTFFSLKVASDKPNHSIVGDYKQAISGEKARRNLRNDVNAGKISQHDYNTNFYSYVAKYQSKLGDDFLTKHAKDYGYEYTKGAIKK